MAEDDKALKPGISHNVPRLYDVLRPRSGWRSFCTLPFFYSTILTSAKAVTKQNVPKAKGRMPRSAIAAVMRCGQERASQTRALLPFHFSYS